MHCAFSLFSVSIPDCDFDRIATLNRGYFESLYHKPTITGLIEVVHFIVVDEHLLANQLLLLQYEVHNDSPFASVKQNNFFYIRFAFFHTPSILIEPPLARRTILLTIGQLTRKDERAERASS
jgi:hypothetical protein